MYYVYVLKSTTKKELYIGYTSNLKRRLDEHNAGKNTSTAGRQWEIIYYEAFKAESDALRRESKLKQRGRSVRHLKDRIKESLE
jgi:putative endonuclease